MHSFRPQTHRLHILLLAQQLQLQRLCCFCSVSAFEAESKVAFAKLEDFLAEAAILQVCMSLLCQPFLARSALSADACVHQHYLTAGHHYQSVILPMHHNIEAPSWCCVTQLFTADTLESHCLHVCSILRYFWIVCSTNTQLNLLCCSRNRVR
jgi:hypothetical protein